MRLGGPAVLRAVHPHRHPFASPSTNYPLAVPTAVPPMLRLPSKTTAVWACRGLVREGSWGVVRGWVFDGSGWCRVMVSGRLPAAPTSATGAGDARMLSATAFGPGWRVGSWVDVVEHPLGLYDPRLRFVLAVEAVDRLEAALCRFQTDAEGAIGLPDQLEGWDCHAAQYGTGARRLHPQPAGVSFRTVQPGPYRRPQPLSSHGIDAF